MLLKRLASQTVFGFIKPTALTPTVMIRRSNNNSSFPNLPSSVQLTRSITSSKMRNNSNSNRNNNFENEPNVIKDENGKIIEIDGVRLKPWRWHKPKKFDQEDMSSEGSAIKLPFIGMLSFIVYYFVCKW